MRRIVHLVLSIRASRAWLGPGRTVDDVRVVVQGGEVLAVGTADEVTPAVRELELDGFLLPAGADRHVHVGLSDPGAILRGGVTAVRDLAWPEDAIFPLAELSESPSFDGPLIRACGPMLTAAGGYPTRASWAPPDAGRVIADVDEAVAVVRGLAAGGAAAVKVSLNAEAGPTIGDAELAAICSAASDAGLPVTAHAQGAGQVERALGAGVDELAHTPWTHRLGEDLLRACAAQLRIVSTLDIQSYGRETADLEIALANLSRFREAGGTVVYGTDLGNGAIPPGVHVRELDLLRRAGFAIDDVLGLLTRAPLAPGTPGDLLVLGGDPGEDLHAFDDLRLVLRGGAVVA